MYRKDPTYLSSSGLGMWPCKIASNNTNNINNMLSLFVPWHLLVGSIGDAECILGI